ncbi:uncharacterized protein TM35_000024170 [Trypanosoma theileri]|uniref:Uncharacterized protein n=1 Tax=Trypanosoma theileri TaxID=67003 RepID=A0A1X0P8C4_9TRYP|nr:uncharacterized protein TM35_000024170 [Trypanosoma theileri]ORC93091.1 hypothetical protein TM35_000024170 [Trypanosoma theileri]
MFRTAFICRRRAVALFTFKHFRPRRRLPMTPANVPNVFAETLDPRDRLLRQSSAGAGASRFLVLDGQQRVRGVYHPVLCLPYPRDGDGVLGITVETYMQRVQEKQQQREQKKEEEGESAAAAGCVFVVLAHGNGLTAAAYAADGACTMLPMHVKMTGTTTCDMRPFVGAARLADDFAVMTAEYFADCIQPCNTFLFLSNTNSSNSSNASVCTFGGMRAAWRERGLDDVSPLRFDDPRWVSLPDTVVRQPYNISGSTNDNNNNSNNNNNNNNNNKTPFFERDIDGDRVPTAAGLAAGMQAGLLELDT